MIVKRVVLQFGGLLALMGAQSGSAQVANYGVGAAGTPPNVRANEVFNPHPVSPDATTEAENWQLAQLARWGGVGKCVAGRDRDASLDYVTAKHRSAKETAAADRLKPTFDACLAGSGIVAKNNEGYRRAAVADALGLKLNRGS